MQCIRGPTYTVTWAAYLITEPTRVFLAGFGALCKSSSVVILTSKMKGIVLATLVILGLSALTEGPYNFSWCKEV